VQSAGRAAVPHPFLCGPAQHQRRIRRRRPPQPVHHRGGAGRHLARPPAASGQADVFPYESNARGDNVMNLHRLIAGLAVGVAAATAAVAAQAAADWPARPIRLIATYGPGSSIDIIARLVAKPLSEQLGQPVIVENKPGAGGDLGTDIIAKADQDGYTIGFASAGPITVNPNARAKMPYDSMKDLAPVALIATGPNVILVNPSLPVQNLQELIAYIKANPDKVSFATAGVGTSGHIAGELFQHLSKTRILHVP